MITTVENCLGHIVSYAEWTIVDSQGRDRDDGLYLLIKEMWIHPDYRNLGMKNIIMNLWQAVKDKPCKYVYWQRRKHNMRLSMLYPIEKIMDRYLERVG